MNTSKCTVSLFTEGAQGYAKTCVTAREGATVEMIQETRRHFAHAVKVLEDGHTRAKAEATKRTVYPVNVYHDEARVTMWGQCNVLCADLNGVVSIPVSINIVTEYTSAQDIVSLVWTLLGALGYTDISTDEREVWKKEQEQPRTNAPQSNATAPTRDLTPTSAVVIQDGQYMGSFDSRQKDAYRAAAGQRLSFDIAKIRGVLEDGVEKWELYSTLANGNAAQYPFTRVYGDARFLPEGLIDGLRAIAKPGGKAVDGKWIGLFKIAVQGEKIYYNAERVKEADLVF